MEQRFTVTFAGDLREIEINPFFLETPFGKARAFSVDDEMLRLDLIEHAELVIPADENSTFRERVIEIMGLGNETLYQQAKARGLLK